MGDVVVKQTDLAYARDDALHALRALRDGAQVTAPWTQALVLEGRVFQVTVGSGTTPVGDGTTWAIARPMLTVGAPTGLSIMPIRVDEAVMKKA